MGSQVVVQFATDRAALPEDNSAIMLTSSTKDLLARKFPVGALCYYDRGSHPLAAGHASMTSFHHDPYEPVRAEGEPLGPYFVALGGVDQLTTAVVGSEVLVLRRLGGVWGEAWWPGTVIADTSAVLLSDGKLIAADTLAVTVANKESAPSDGAFELSADGQPWTKPKKGPPVRLDRFCGPAAPLGQLVASGARCFMYQTQPSPARRWAFAELAS